MIKEYKKFVKRKVNAEKGSKIKKPLSHCTNKMRIAMSILNK